MFWIGIEGVVLSDREWAETTTSVWSDQRGKIQSSTSRREFSDVVLDGGDQQHHLRNIIYGARPGQTIRVEFLRQRGWPNLALMLREFLARPRDARLSTFSFKAPPSFRNSFSRGAVVTNLSTKEVTTVNPHRTLDVLAMGTVVSLGGLLAASLLFGSARQAHKILSQRKAELESDVGAGLRVPATPPDEVRTPFAFPYGWIALVALAVGVAAVNYQRLSATRDEYAPPAMVQAQLLAEPTITPSTPEPLRLDAMPLPSGYFRDSHTGHVYTIVNQSGLSWHQARDAAGTMSLGNSVGYLATITSHDEWDFIRSSVPNNEQDVLYVGGSDDVDEGDWRWVTGPEGRANGGQGVTFWSGTADGKVSNSLFAVWQPTAFQVGGPFDSNEADYLTMYSYRQPEFSTTRGDMAGVSATNGGATGYLVEFSSDY